MLWRPQKKYKCERNSVTKQFSFAPLLLRHHLSYSQRHGHVGRVCGIIRNRILVDQQTIVDD